EELRLAQLEMTQKGKRAGIGAGMLGGGGVIALYGVAAVLAGAILALTLVLPAWASALIVGGALLAVSAVLALAGRKQVQQAMPPVPEQTQASVEADVKEIKERWQRCPQTTRPTRPVSRRRADGRPRACRTTRRNWPKT